MMTEGTWQQHLVQLHPGLFIRNFRGVPFCPGYPTVAADGWREIISTLLKRVSTAAAGYPIYFVQLCEEHGRLRIQWRAEATLPKHVEHAIEEAIARAEARSTCSCATCGAKGRLFVTGGRLITACVCHARGVPVPVYTGMEDLHLLRKRINGSSTITCVRYDFDHDQFSDIDPSLVGRR
jgi:hypothetical protein